MDLVVKNKQITDISTELLPLLMKCQYLPGLAKREGIDKLISSVNQDYLKDAMALSTSHRIKAGANLEIKW